MVDSYTRRHQELLRHAAQHLQDGPHLHFRNPQARHQLARTLQRWASEIERGSLHPAIRTAALDLARNIVHDHRWTDTSDRARTRAADIEVGRHPDPNLPRRI